MDLYRLNGHTPVKCKNEKEAGMYRNHFRVAKTTVGEIEISTVFLAVDHRLSKAGPPILFETMVFGGELDQKQERYSTWEEAEAGHKAMVKQVKQALR